MKDLLKKYISTRRKKSLWFVLARKSVSTTQNEVSVEKCVSTIRKICFFWQKNRKWFPLAEKYFSVKIDSANFNHGFPQQKKGSEQKYTVSTRQKISFH